MKSHICCLMVIFSWHTNNELTIAPSYEHRSFLFFGSFWLLGRHGLLGRGREGDRQVRGVLWGSSRARQSGCCDGGNLDTVSLSRRRSSFGHNVDHGLLVALHAGTKLKKQRRRIPGWKPAHSTVCLKLHTWTWPDLLRKKAAVSYCKHKTFPSAEICKTIRVMSSSLYQICWQEGTKHLGMKRWDKIR